MIKYGLHKRWNYAQSFKIRVVELMVVVVVRRRRGGGGVWRS
jgi:hypothetical protein